MRKQVLLSILMLLPMLAFAHDIEVKNEDGVTIYYNYTNNGTELAVTFRGSDSNYTSYSDRYKGKLVIPEEVTYGEKTYKVTSIGNNAFYGCTGLTSVTIPNSVTSIGGHAFQNCSGLTSVTIPNSVTSIGENAFSNTAWYSNQPDGLVYAGNVAYQYKGTMPSNTSITIKEGTIAIASNAFSGCSGLTSVTIPNSVTSIGVSVFSYCKELSSIIVDANNIKYDSRKNCNAIIETATNTLIQGCNNTVIPNSVKSIGEWAFAGCSGLTSVTIPNSVTSIGESAFSGCSGLTSVTIPNSVTSIGEWAFAWCTGLTSVIIPNSVTSIGICAFYGCSGLTSVTIPNSVTSIGSYAFYQCSGLKKVIVKDIAAWCGIEFGSFDANPLYHAHHLYSNENTEIKDLVIPNGVTSISFAAFAYCSGLTSITIPNSVTSIGTDAFSGCTGLTSVTINCKKVGTWFSSLSSIKSITLGNNVESIEQSAFYGSKGISSVTINCKNVGAWFSSLSSIQSITLGNNVESIEQRAFYGCSGLTSITIPNSVKSIGWYAFSNCTDLTSIVIPNSVTSIGTDAFYNCTGLQKVIVPDIAAWCGIEFDIHAANPLYYAKHLYSDENTEIKDLIIPNSVKSIGGHAFYGCTGLTSVTIPNSVTSIGGNAFRECSGLQKVIVSDIAAWCGIEFGSFDANPLYHAHHLYSDENTEIKDLIIPNSLASIGHNAFRECTGLTSVKIPNSVTNIGESAFQSCSGLASIEIPNSVTSIGGYAFGGNTNLTIVKTKIEDPGAITMGGNVFVNISPNAILQVPKGTKEAYMSRSTWSSYFREVEEFNVILSEGNIDYVVLSEVQKTVNVANGEYGNVLTVPATINADDSEWNVMGIEADVRNNSELSAIFWNPEVAFSGSVSNVNLLLYVKDKQYAPSNIKNVVVNGEAEEIVLQDAESGNNFYCPQAFIAKRVSYVHNYSMKTGFKTCQGWESIVLPFDVTTILNANGEEIVPISALAQGDNHCPFWLYSMSSDGWKPESSIKANTPYIISMPNNDEYDPIYNQSGNVQFIGTNVEVKSSDNMPIEKKGNKTFVPNYQNQPASDSMYALNVNNQWSANTVTEAEGSVFVKSLRPIHPFEAYLTVSGADAIKRLIPIFEDDETGIMELQNDGIKDLQKGTYDMTGRKVHGELKRGVYIVNGKKVMVK